VLSFDEEGIATMRERLPRQSQSAKDDSILRFNPPQVRTIAIQALVIVSATVLSGLRVVEVGISAWWLVPLAFVL
jgi:hypothetical protein